MVRIRALALAFVLLPLAVARAQDGDAAAARAPEAPVAARFPADTLAYAEIDADAFAKGAGELALLKLLDDEKLRAFFRPTIDRLGLDPEKPAASLLAKLPVRAFVDGRAAVGLRGLLVRIRENGKETVIPLSARSPVDARLVYRLLGLALRDEAGRGDEIEVEIAPDALLVVEPGARLRKLVADFLADPPVAIERETVVIGAHEVERFRTGGGFVQGLDLSDLYASLGEDRWIVATSRDTLAAALDGPRTPLADAPRFTAVRERFTAGHAVALAWVDLGFAAKIVEALVPPIVGDLNRINGLASLRGAAFGLSLVEGGVRESVGLVLDGEPKGVWTVLDALPGGLRSLEVAPPGAIAVVGLKFDARVLFERIRAVAAEVVPGNEDLVERELARELARVGFDLHKELLPALGDEVAVFVFPPKMPLIPDVVIGMDIRDAEAFGAVLEKVKRELAEAGVAAFEPLDLGDGIRGVRVSSRVPVLQAFAVHDGHFFAAARPELLEQVLGTWGAEGAPTLLRDGKVFAQTLRGLNGGTNANLSALAYVNIRDTLPQVYGVLPMARITPPAEWVDTTQVPDVARMGRFFHGAAVGLRNDRHGLVVDVHSPTGVLVPALVVAARAEAMRQRAIEKRQREAAVRIARAQGGGVSTGILGRGSDGEGVTLFRLASGGAAENAGLQAGDRIVAIGGKPVRHIEEMDAILEKVEPGQRVPFTVERDGERMDVVVALGQE